MTGVVKQNKYPKNGGFTNDSHLLHLVEDKLYYSRGR